MTDLQYVTYQRQGDPPPYVPFLPQAEFLSYLQGHTRAQPARAMAVWPRRHGKDLTALNHLLTAAHDRVGLYWHGLPSYEQARKSCWVGFRTDTGQRLMDNVFPRELVRRPNEWAPNAEMLVELRNGSIVQFVGSDTIDKLVGAGLAGINCSEFALWRPSAYDLVRPILREAGAWATFLFTPRGHNHAYKLFKKARENPRWFTSFHTIYTFGRYTRAAADELLAQERAEGMLEELVRQEYLCDFSAAMVGSYWGDLLGLLESTGAMRAFQHDGDDVYVAWDLGIGDQTAMWAFKVRMDGADFLAHYSAHSKPLEHYYEVQEVWAKQLGFKYAQQLVPHDAKSRTLQTGVSVFDQLLKRYGTAGLRLVPDIGVQDGIQAVRRLLQTKVRFHPRCEEYDGLEALKQYHRTYDEDRKVFTLHPEHDWSSDSADALRYAAVAMELIRGAPRKKAATVVIVPPSVGVSSKITLDEAWEETLRDQPRRRA